MQDEVVPVVPVVLVQMRGSPATVHQHLNEALSEIRQLLMVMLEDEAAPLPIQLRVGTMSRKALDDLREFPGY